MTEYTVCGPVAAIKDDTGKLRYYYHGSPVPHDLPPTELRRLADIGLIEKADPQIVPGLPAPVVVERPSDKAPKAAWVDHAVAHGMDRAEAEKLSRDELAARFPASG